MNANWYDGELRLNESRALARAAAENYQLWPARPRRLRGVSRRLRGVYRSTLVATGGMLIALGQRLQGHIDELATPPALDLGLPRQMPNP